MASFTINEQPLDPAALKQQLSDAHCGGYVTFEGWVRNHNEGKTVQRLEYEVYVPLALSEGARVLDEAKRLFGVRHAVGVHRSGELDIGDCAVWVAVSSAHRAEAFDACRYVIDQVKQRLPIWKKEHYVDGDSGWVNCERCAHPDGHHQHTDHKVAAKQ